MENLDKWLELSSILADILENFNENVSDTQIVGAQLVNNKPQAYVISVGSILVFLFYLREMMNPFSPHGGIFNAFRIVTFILILGASNLCVNMHVIIAVAFR